MEVNMEIIVIVVLWIIGAAIYFNFGWMVMEYYDKGAAKPKLKPFAKIAAGPRQIFFSSDKWEAGKRLNPFEKAIVNICWPMIIGSVALSWIIYGLYWLFWLIFAGGIVKLSKLA